MIPPLSLNRTYGFGFHGYSSPCYLLFSRFRWSFNKYHSFGRSDLTQQFLALGQVSCASIASQTLLPRNIGISWFNFWLLGGPCRQVRGNKCGHAHLYSFMSSPSDPPSGRKGCSLQNTSLWCIPSSWNSLQGALSQRRHIKDNHKKKTKQNSSNVF